MVGQVEKIHDDKEQLQDGCDDESSILDTVQELELLVQDCGRLEEYNDAYQSVTETIRTTSLDELGLPEGCTLSVLERLEMASWAAMRLALAMEQRAEMHNVSSEPKYDPSTSRYQALATVNTMDRLMWAMDRLTQAKSFQ